MPSKKLDAIEVLEGAWVAILNGDYDKADKLLQEASAVVKPKKTEALPKRRPPGWI